MAKFFAIFVLVLFLLFSALSSLMYLTNPSDTKAIQQMQLDCQNNQGVRDEETGQCFVEDEIFEAKTKESCEAEGLIWYEANGVCV